MNGKRQTAVTRIYLALGSNLGNRMCHLAHGVGLLRDHMKVPEVSSVYETEPVGPQNQPPYLNLVLRVETTRTPQRLLELARLVEARSGRSRTYRWGPRALDVDILLFGRRSVNDVDLQIPHPEMLRRAFVLVPLCEIAPDARFPDGSRVCPASRHPGIEDQGIRKLGPLPAC